MAVLILPFAYGTGRFVYATDCLGGFLLDIHRLFPQQSPGFCAGSWCMVHMLGAMLYIRERFPDILDFRL
jgi:hypothetical protein